VAVISYQPEENDGGSWRINLLSENGVLASGGEG